MRTANSNITWTNALTKSVAASSNSDPYPVKNMVLAAITVTIASGTAPTGTWKVQASNDEGHDPGTGLKDVSGLTTWVDITGASQAITDNGSVLFSLVNMTYRWIRIVWTSTSGTGTASAIVNAKGWS